MLGQKKATLSKNNKMKTKNKDKIDNFSTEIKILQKYRARIGTLNEGKKTLKIGKGIYTQPKLKWPIWWVND